MIKGWGYAKYGQMTITKMSAEDIETDWKGWEFAKNQGITIIKST